ncbi:MAG: type II secretion system protein [Candidatus Omnitrophica bacterium]|nr:type II secretion system protein [Candidatus Omnitrophota bacterium]
MKVSRVPCPVSRGVTLLEILMAMLIMGMITSGIFVAFVFARQVSQRSESELQAIAAMQTIGEETRLAVGQTSPMGLNMDTLANGIWVDQFMVQPPATAQVLTALDMPADWRARYQTNAGRTPAATLADHGDGRMMIIEDLVDLDGDELAGVDLNPSRPGAELRRVQVRVRWTSPK